MLTAAATFEFYNKTGWITPVIELGTSSDGTGMARALVCYRDNAAVWPDQPHLTCNLMSLGETATDNVVASKRVVTTEARVDGGLAISLAKLDNDKAIVCYKLYQGASGNMACSCNALEVAGTGLDEHVSPTSNLLLSTNMTSDISVTGLDSSNAIVCYKDHATDRLGNSGICKHVSLSTTPFGLTSTGSSSGLLISDWYSDGWARAGSVAAFDSSSAIVCYGDMSSTPANAGTCKFLSWSGTALTAGIDIVFNVGASRDVNVIALDSSNAIVCYKDYANGESGTCNLLQRSGGAVSVGTAAVFVAPTVEGYGANVNDISVAKISASEAIVCYRANKGTCKPLSVSGTSITVGAEALFVDGYMGNRPSVTGLSQGLTKALVCYPDTEGDCTRLAYPSA